MARPWLDKRRAEVLRLFTTTCLTIREIAEELDLTTYRVWRDIRAAEGIKWVREKPVRQTKCSLCAAHGRKICMYTGK